MPKDLRFCRNCGFRLGEGSAEYTETVRFQDVRQGAFGPGGTPNSYPYGMGGPLAGSPGGRIKKGNRRRMSGMTWMFLGLLIFFVCAAGFTAVVKQVGSNFHGRIATVVAPRSYFGVDGFETADDNGGVTFANVEPPGSPADKAGLVGGDIITTVDGQPVHSDDEMMEILRRIPIGKTVDVVYIRDGETKNTKVTTMSKDDSDRLSKEFDDRPEGRGRFGYNERRSERVEIPGTKMFGVRLDRLEASLPADMAGIKEGDVVIEFNGIPIRTPEELHSRVRRAKPYETVDLVVIRGGERLQIPVKMGKL
jgi:membrane-associated protease RseP (regulator of RpoE activity)